MSRAPSPILFHGGRDADTTTAIDIELSGGVWSEMRCGGHRGRRRREGRDGDWRRGLRRKSARNQMHKRGDGEGDECDEESREGDRSRGRQVERETGREGSAEQTSQRGGFNRKREGVEGGRKTEQIVSDTQRKGRWREDEDGGMRKSKMR